MVKGCVKCSQETQQAFVLFCCCLICSLLNGYFCMSFIMKEICENRNELCDHSCCSFWVEFLEKGKDFYQIQLQVNWEHAISFNLMALNILESETLKNLLKTWVSAQTKHTKIHIHKFLELSMLAGCYTFYLDAPPKLHAVIGGAFSAVGEFRACDWFMV